MKKYGFVLIGLALALRLLALPTSAVPEPDRCLQPLDYIVNTTSYTNDGSCDSLDTGDCTLWEALELAAAAPGIDAVGFDIPVTDTNYGHNTIGVWTIVLTQTLPSTIETIVDGTTQATNYGSETNPYGPEIEISGENLVGQNSWLIRSDNTIKGLAINRCTGGYALWVYDGDDNTMVGNYIGTDAEGSSAVTAGAGFWGGILLGDGAENNIIGGSTADDRNIISGMGDGIRVYQISKNTSGNVIEGNYIGTDRTGTQPLGNEACGIFIYDGAHNNTVGPDNVIAHNGWHGVWMDGLDSNGNTITRNYIHTNGGKGIALTDDANGNLGAPYHVVGNCSGGSAHGGLGLTWEAFSDLDGEGRFFESTGDTGLGFFSFSSADVLFRYPHVTLTVTDGSGNTSELSEPVPSGCLLRYLALTMKAY
jgi:hypothetical protein